MVPLFDVYVAREKAARGELDDAVQQLRTAVDEMVTTGNFGNYDIATGALVETLLARGTDGDLVEAEAAIERMAATLASRTWWAGTSPSGGPPDPRPTDCESVARASATSGNGYLIYPVIPVRQRIWPSPVRFQYVLGTAPERP